MPLERRNMQEESNGGNVRIERQVRRLPGRREPYTQIGIRRMRCARCGERARYQWQVCADHNTWRPICERCDVELNRMVLEWIGHPETENLMDAYELAHSS